jgi:diguanylate cyclase (GGDEF)-like protein
LLKKLLHKHIALLLSLCYNTAVMSTETNNLIQTIDPLTGLHNRAGLMNELENNLYHNPDRFAVVLVDVDGLKQMNDTLGHEAGDELIVNTANILSNSLRTTAGREDDSVSHVYRLGGDEFVLVLKKVETEDDLDKIVDRLTQNLANDGPNGGIKASMGGLVVDKWGLDASTVLGAADRKMYQVKALNKDMARQKATFEAKQEDRKRVSELGPAQFYAFTASTLLKRYVDKKTGLQDIH